MGCNHLRISTPSRLHFGIIDMRGDMGRLHGSAGVAIESPRLILEVQEAGETLITGARSDRAQQIIEQVLGEHKVEAGVRLDIQSDIPEHMGFGSGTQLTISLGTALNKIFDLGMSYEDIVVGLGRSRRSGIGTHSFLHGGFIVDGGHAIDAPETIPPLIHRTDVPDDWLFVVCIPDINTGFSGAKETEAFKHLEPPPVDMIAHVSRLVLMQMIPSILEEDITLFGDAMTKLDTIFGEYWATMQGGTYSHPRIEDCVNHLLGNGAYGAGQSSWGPALYGLVEGNAQARELSDEMERFVNQGENSGSVFITAADNKGVQIS
jgi:beta-ribofuranosylaminobenzene 5'-phosphate synthase